MRASVKSTISVSVIVLITAVAVILCWFQWFPYLLWEKEANSFFSWTNDYLRWVSTMPAPASVLLGDFLTQFYRFPLIGSMLQAVFVIAVYLSGLTILRRFNVPGWLDWIPVVAAAILWIYQFDEESLVRTMPYVSFFFWLAIFSVIPGIWKRMTVIVPAFLFLPLKVFFIWMAVAFALWIIIRKDWRWDRSRSDRYFISVIIAAAVIGGTLWYNTSNEDHRKAERLGNIQFYAFTERWDALSRLICHPEKYENAEVPYILLTLSSRGLLGDRIFHYPIYSEDFFLFSGVGTRDAYFFNQLFYDHLTMYNEAVHMVYQEKTRTRYPMSFRILMNLVKFESHRGDYVQVNKYLDLLNTATCYKSWVKSHRPSAEETAATDTRSQRRTFFITGNTLSNLHYETECGNLNADMNTYYLCSLLIRKNLQAFINHIKSHTYLIDNYIPSHFLEAMILADAQGFKIGGMTFSQDLYERFTDFQRMIGEQDKEGIISKYRDTYWFNYYFMTLPEESSSDSE